MCGGMETDMIEIKKKISEALFAKIKEMKSDIDMTADDVAVMLEYPPDSKMGDLALPCFKLSKTMRNAPVKIALSLSEGFASEYVERVEAVNGYFNIYLAKNAVADKVVSEIREKREKYGAPDMGVGKTVVLDYSSPNVAKPFHIGHLGTTVIGHSLKKLHEFAGYKCIGINYLGDWGTQFGKLITAYKLWGDRAAIEDGGVDELVKLYVKINNEIKAEEEAGKTDLADASRAEFKKLEESDEDNLKLWRWFVDISLEEYQKTYKQLGIEFDSYKGESFYTDKMPAEVEKLRASGLLKIDDGASIVDLEEYGMPPCLILKKDGSTLYPTRDIAAAVYRKNTYNFDKAIYVTSAGQSLHFAQWFKVVELMGYDWYDQVVHVPYGTVSINGAKLATRTGNVILLKDLFATAIEKVADIMNEKNPNIENKEEIAEAVGVGAIVFYYLSNNRMRDINFMMDDALSFEGNTGPYAQYTYARTSGILEKAGEVGCGGSATTVEEFELVKTLSFFSERVLGAIEEYEPSIIARYAMEVCTAFNRFYHNCQILSAEDKDTRDFRVRLTDATRVVLGNAFDLICMKKTEKI